MEVAHYLQKLPRLDRKTLVKAGLRDTNQPLKFQSCSFTQILTKSAWITHEEIKNAIEVSKNYTSTEKEWMPTLFAIIMENYDGFNIFNYTEIQIEFCGVTRLSLRRPGTDKKILVVDYDKICDEVDSRIEKERIERQKLVSRVLWSGGVICTIAGIVIFYFL